MFVITIIVKMRGGKIMASPACYAGMKKLQAWLSSTAYRNVKDLGIIFHLSDQDVMREALKQFYENTYNVIDRDEHKISNVT